MTLARLMVLPWSPAFTRSHTALEPRPSGLAQITLSAISW
jgi:hypothetical protein